jgi:hypothetical protein
MPGTILHLGATVQCMHGGTAVPTETEPRVLIGGMPVTTMAAPYTVAGCAMPAPPSGNGPCVTAQWVTSATRIEAGGLPLLLLDSQSICAPTGTPLLVVQTQTRVTGI